MTLTDILNVYVIAVYGTLLTAILFVLISSPTVEYYLRTTLWHVSISSYEATIYGWCGEQTSGILEGLRVTVDFPKRAPLCSSGSLR
jgi:hypothetical protein